MIGLITVAWHGYLAQQIVHMFITTKKLLPSLHQHRINIEKLSMLQIRRSHIAFSASDSFYGMIMALNQIFYCLLTYLLTYLVWMEVLNRRTSHSKNCSAFDRNPYFRLKVTPLVWRTDACPIDGSLQQHAVVLCRADCSHSWRPAQRRSSQTRGDPYGPGTSVRRRRRCPIRRTTHITTGTAADDRRVIASLSGSAGIRDRPKRRAISSDGIADL